MSTQTIISPVLNTTDEDDDLEHVYCCNENLALCGTDLTTYPEAEGTYEAPTPDTCLVCDDLSHHPCKECDQ